MIRLTDAEYLGNFRVRLEFSDGTSGVADFQGRLDGPIFIELNDPDVFGRFELTDHTLQWPNGADFAPEFLRDLIAQTEPTNLQTSTSPVRTPSRSSGSD